MLTVRNDSHNRVAEPPFSDNIARYCSAKANIRQNEYSNACVTRDRETLLDLIFQDGRGAVISGQLCWAATW